MLRTDTTTTKAHRRGAIFAFDQLKAPFLILSVEGPAVWHFINRRPKVPFNTNQNKPGGRNTQRVAYTIQAHTDERRDVRMLSIEGPSRRLTQTQTTTNLEAGKLQSVLRTTDTTKTNMNSG